MDKIINPVNKHELIFIKRGIETGGKYLEMDSYYPEKSFEPPAHYHPNQTETFCVLEGELITRSQGIVKVLKKGDNIIFEPNTIHSMWNANNTPARVNWKSEPAMRTEEFFRNVFGLANDGKVNNKGMPGLLQSALLGNEFSGEFRLAKPPFIVQKVVFAIFGIIGNLKGLKSTYPEYLK